MSQVLSRSGATDSAGREHLRCPLIGVHASEALAVTHRGQVAAVFDRSWYIALHARPRDALICIGSPELPAGPLNLVTCTAPRHAVSAGDTVNVSGRQLRVGASLLLDYGNASTWAPPAAPAHDAASVTAGLAQLEHIPTGQFPAQSLLTCILRDAQPLHDPVHTAAHKALPTMFRWLLDHATLDAQHWPRQLLGLGRGLTPSGDDLLAGALVTLDMLDKTSARDALATHIEPLLARCTTPLSAAHLRAAMHGAAAEPLHRVVADTLSAQAPRASLDALAGVGHTSGWDALAGVIMTLRAHIAT